MHSSYSNNDVELLLKDITGLVTPLPAEIREKYIQSGTHYCEMLPLEYKPSEQYMQLYLHALTHYAKATAEAVEVVSEIIFSRKNRCPVIVSLARAGIPIGILIKRYLFNKYNVSVPHYAVSIIRGRGIDKNAIKFILARHKAQDIQFVDGWIGKGAIIRQLCNALEDFPDIGRELAVVSDPANITALCGTHEDILIPSSCLNATVTGLISRTFLRKDIIGENDFHGAACYDELKDEDLSEQFLESVQKWFSYDKSPLLPVAPENINGMDIVRNIAAEYNVSDINFIKPGIGEATRVLLRRIPWKIIVNEKYSRSDELKHIYRLSQEKSVPVEISSVPLGCYKVCGIIKKLSDV